MIKIVTDSSINLDQELINQYDITIVPLSILVDGVIYSDSELKEEGRFLELMTVSRSLPKTSQPSVGLFAEAYKKLVAAGASDIIAIHLSSNLSGTLEASRQGALLSQSPVTLWDSGVVDQALAFQVLEAAKLAQEGASREAILRELARIKAKTGVYLGMSRLDHLVKGGRVNRLSGIWGSLLKVHVLLTLTDNQLRVLAKGRGQKTFQTWLEQLEGQLSQSKVRQLAISYAGQSDFAQGLATRLQVYLSEPIEVRETGAVIQTHTGPDAFAVMVYYD